MYGYIYKYIFKEIITYWIDIRKNNNFKVLLKALGDDSHKNLVISGPK